MQLFVNPPAELWHRCLAPVSCGVAEECGPLREAALGRLGAALDALYQVQARLWAIPDKAETIPGVSFAVTRRPLTEVAVELPEDVADVELLSLRAAAKAVGVELTLLSDGAHRNGALRLGDVPLPRAKAVFVVADHTSRLDAVAQDVARLVELGECPVVLTSSAYTASALAAAVDDARGVVKIAMLADAAQVVEALTALRPGLVIDETEGGRSLGDSLSFEMNLLYGPLAGAAALDSLLVMRAPIYPVHVFMNTLLTIDPVTAK